MAEIHVCEHIEAVTLGPNDRMAIVCPEGMSIEDMNVIAGPAFEWWPDRVLVVQEPLRIVAVAESDESVNTEAANQ